MSTKRKTRASESAAATPDSKRRKAAEIETAEKTQTFGLELLELLKSSRDKRNRLISAEFETLPIKDELPDYYEVIKLPLALDTIEGKLRKLEYPTLTTLESDLKRMVANAKEYNERDSEIHADAEKIRRVVHTFMTQHNPAYEDASYQAFPTALPDPPDEDEIELKTSSRKTRRRGLQDVSKEESVGDEAEAQPENDSGPAVEQTKRRLTLNGPREVGAVPSKAPAPGASALELPPPDTSSQKFDGKTFQEAQEIIMQDLLVYANDEGVEISGPFENLPPRDLKDYYQIVKYPVSIRSIQKKIRGQKGRDKATGQTLFTSWQAFVDELSFIWNNARLYNEEGSKIYEAAGELEAYFQKRLRQAKAVIQEPPQPKLTLRVQAKEPEPATKLKLHLSSKPSTSEGYVIDAEALKRQQEIVANATNSEARAASKAADEPTSTEIKTAASPEEPQTNGIKVETTVSQSPAPAGVQVESTAPAESAESANSKPAAPASTAPAAEGSTPAPASPPAPPPPPPRDPLEARLRPTGKGIEDALISKFALSAHPSQLEQSFRLLVPPSKELSQQSISVTLPESQRLLRLATAFPASLFQRQHRIITRLNKDYLHPIQGRPEDMDQSSRTFDVNLVPGTVNILDLEVLVSLLPRGATKAGNGSDYDYERTTVYLNVFSSS